MDYKLLKNKLKNQKCEVCNKKKVPLLDMYVKGKLVVICSDCFETKMEVDKNE